MVQENITRKTDINKNSDNVKKLLADEPYFDNRSKEFCLGATYESASIIAKEIIKERGFCCTSVC